ISVRRGLQVPLGSRLVVLLNAFALRVSHSEEPLSIDISSLSSGRQGCNLRGGDWFWRWGCLVLRCKDEGSSQYRGEHESADQAYIDRFGSTGFSACLEEFTRSHCLGTNFWSTVEFRSREFLSSFPDSSNLSPDRHMTV